MRALNTIQETGRATFPCIRFFTSKVGYRYGDLYPRGSYSSWKVGDLQQ